MTAEPSYPVSATAYGQRVATYFGFAPATPAAKAGDMSMIMLLRRNNLGALAHMIERDPSIPMAPGQCAWTREACLVNRQVHGPCLDHS